MNSNHNRGKIVLTLLALLSSFIPVSAQLDQQWQQQLKQRKSDISECLTNHRKAQYTSRDGDKYYYVARYWSPQKNEGVFYIDKSKIIWNIIIGFECRQNQIGKINQEIKAQNSILFKIEDNKLIQYYESNLRQSEMIMRIIIGTEIKPQLLRPIQ